MDHDYYQYPKKHEKQNFYNIQTIGRNLKK